MQPRTLPQLRLQASSIWFTDGSKHTNEIGSHIIGSGVHNADKGLSLSVNAKGLGATNTITRAELAAIAVALRHMDRTCDVPYCQLLGRLLWVDN